MSQRRGIGKRGQEGLSITTLLVLVLGIVVVVLLILGLTGGFDFIFGKFKLLPGQDLQAVAESCSTSANLDLKLDYCGFKKLKIDGETEYVNCEDTRVQSALESELRDKVKCDTDNDFNQCVKLIEDAEFNVKVNGRDITRNSTGVLASSHCGLFKVPITS